MAILNINQFPVSPNRVKLPAITPSVEFATQQRVLITDYNGNISFNPLLDNPVTVDELPRDMQNACRSLLIEHWPTSKSGRIQLDLAAEQGDELAIKILTILQHEKVYFNGKNNISFRGGLSEVISGEPIDVRTLEYAFIKAYSQAYEIDSPIGDMIAATPRLAGAGLTLLTEGSKGIEIVASIKGKGQAGEGQVLAAASAGGMEKNDFSSDDPVFKTVQRETEEELGILLQPNNFSRSTLVLDDLQTGNGSILKIGFIRDINAFLHIVDKHVKYCTELANNELSSRGIEPTDENVLRFLEGGFHKLPGGFRLHPLSDGFATNGGLDFVIKPGKLMGSDPSDLPTWMCRAIRPQSIGVFGWLHDNYKKLDVTLSGVKPVC
jgi:hypothetical protein